MNANYVVMIVTIIIWVALFVYLVSLDRKTKKFEDRA